MINEIDLKINFTNEKYQKEFDEQVRKEQIMTMSDHYIQTIRDIGTIRYFFGGYRDGVDWDGHYLVNAFFSEENSIGLSIFNSVSRLMKSKKFYDQFKIDLRDYIEFLNHNSKSIGDPVFSTKNIEQIVQNAEYADHSRVFND